MSKQQRGRQQRLWSETEANRDDFWRGADFPDDSDRLTLTICEIVMREVDCFFAPLDSVERYGTLVEIGHAKALNKLIAIVATDYAQGKDDPLWFAKCCCDHYFSGTTRNDALNQFFRWIAKAYPRPDVFRKPIELAHGLKKTATLVFGNPVEYNSYIFPGKDGPIDPYRTITRIDNISSIIKYMARGARFEHGNTH
jgi:hypothetical protein